MNYSIAFLALFFIQPAVRTFFLRTSGLPVVFLLLKRKNTNCDNYFLYSGIGLTFFLKRCIISL